MRTPLPALSAPGRKHSDEIIPMRKYWEAVATGVLDAVRPTAKDSRTTSQVAKGILEWELTDSPARGGGHGGGQRARGENALDLATRLQIKHFIAHRYCQEIMAQSWAGHLDDPRVRLRLEDDTAPYWKIALKAFLPWHFAERLQWVAKVEANLPVDGADARRDAHDELGADDEAEGGDGGGGGDELPGFWHVYSIPAIKFWARTTFTYGGIALLKSALVFGTSITQPHALSARPGPIQGALEVAFAVWVVGIAVDSVETQTAQSGLKPAWVRTDSIALALQLVLVCLRVGYVIAGEASGAPGQAGRLAVDARGYGHVDAVTGWLFPIVLSLSSLACFFRFMITLLIFPRLGVLAISTREMLANNLMHWGIMMAIVLVAFGLAFSAIAPDYPHDASSRGCYVSDVDDAWRRATRGNNLGGAPACESRFAMGPWFISVRARASERASPAGAQQRGAAWEGLGRAQGGVACAVRRSALDCSHLLPPARPATLLPSLSAVGTLWRL